MQQSLSIRQTCVRSTLNCLALAMFVALVIAFAGQTGTTFALRFVGDVLVVTALAQGVLAWMVRFSGDEEGEHMILLGGLSTIASAGVLFLASFLL